MILGIGTDLANIERIAGVLDRFGDRFRSRRPLLDQPPFC